MVIVFCTNGLQFVALQSHLRTVNFTFYYLYFTAFPVHFNQLVIVLKMFLSPVRGLDLTYFFMTDVLKLLCLSIASLMFHFI